MQAQTIVTLRPVGSQSGEELSRQAQLALAAQLPLLTKVQLSRHYGLSTRWVEYQLVKGMPSRLIGGRRRFDLGEVDRWLRETYREP